MTPDGLKPANPFPDERAFDDALVMNFYPVPGHQGKFCASHAKAALGVIIEYQNQRRYYLRFSFLTNLENVSGSLKYHLQGVQMIT